MTEPIQLAHIDHEALKAHDFRRQALINTLQQVEQQIAQIRAEYQKAEAAIVEYIKERTGIDLAKQPARLDLEAGTITPQEVEQHEQ